VGAHRLHVELLEPGEAVAVAVGDAHGVTAVGQQFRDVPPDEPRRARHTDGTHATVLARTFAEQSGNFARRMLFSATYTPKHRNQMRIRLPILAAALSGALAAPAAADASTPDASGAATASDQV